MITTFYLTGLNPPPYDPARKLPVAPTAWHDPEGRACVASWQVQVDAGRIGKKAPVDEDAREIILANERLMFGRQRTIIG